MPGTLTRRTMLKTGAVAAAAGALPLPFTHGAHAAGKLSVAVWDHWVPGANEVLQKIAQEWADKEKVELTLDFVTSQGDKLMLMGAAEQQAKSGHDVIGQPSWYAPAKADAWEPADDMMKELIAKYGEPSAAIKYLGIQNGHWIAVPSIPNTLTLPSVARIDLFKEHLGLDVTQMYPAGGPPNKELADKWTWDNWLDMAEKMHKAGFAFGMPLGQTGDSMNWVGNIFAAHGAELVDKDGNVTVKSDATKHLLDFFKRLVPFLPDSVYAWDDSSNNKALISGQSAFIMNPPSAWAVAVRDNPKVGEQCWHFPSPKGPKGRFDAAQPSYWGIWSFSQNKAAGRSLLMHLWEKESVGRLVEGSKGYDIPAFATLRDFPTWADEGPPKGGIWNYPPRGEVVENVSGSPAPARSGNQIFAQATTTKMIAQYVQQGKTMQQAMDWAASELDGFMRS